MASKETGIQRADSNADIVREMVVSGDLSKLNSEQLVRYYGAECSRLGLDPISRPFDLLRLQGKLVLYANRRCADQLAAKHNITRTIVEDPQVRDYAGTKLLYCKVRVSTPGGRVEEDVATLEPKDLVNAIMKIATKAARRATLKVCGWGGIDESEIETIRGAERVTIEQLDRERSASSRLADNDTITVTHATPLDMLRDDLASVSTPEGIREAYRTHARDIAEMDEDGDAIRAARNACHEAVVEHGFGARRIDTDRILGKGERPVVAQPAPAEREVEVLVAAEHPAVTALREALDVASSLDGVVAVWRQAGGEVKSLEESDKVYAWQLAVEAGARIGATTREAAEAALRALLAGPKGDGPKGTRKVAAKPANDAQGTAAEGTASAGPQARAPIAESAPYVAADGAEAWAARVARYTNTIELRRSYEKHAPSFRAAGVLEARRAVSASRLQALANIADESIAQRVLDDAERAADAAARVASTARRTGRSEITVRREARDAAERTLRKVA